MEKFNDGKLLDLGSIGKTKNPWIHFLAIGGTGMGALASLFKTAGARITGSDGPLYPPMSTFLKDQNISIKDSYSPQNLSGSSWGIDQEYPDVVIVGNAISRTNVEAGEVEKLFAKKLIKRMSFPEAIGNFVIGNRESFVVAGTHGKTTTTSLLAWAFEVLKKSPGFFIGGIPKNFETGSRWGSNVFAIEGDEYDTAYWDKESKFLHYRPTWVIGTGIEFDHADIFSSVEQIENSFLKLCEMTKEGWLLIDRLSAPKPSSVEKIAHKLEKLKKKVIRYGEDKDSTYCLLGWERTPLPWNGRAYGLKFNVQAAGENATFFTPMVGHHNLLNAVGVMGVLHASGYLKKLSDFQEVLRTFSGVARRQDLLLETDSFIVIDDFAHHPTAIKETIEAIREKYPGYSVAAFFEPRSATSARNLLYDDFVKSFGAADAVYIQEATKQNVPEVERLKVNDLVKALIGKGSTKTACARKTLDDLFNEFLTWKNQNKKVVALVMSNGSFSGLGKKIEGVDLNRYGVQRFSLAKRPDASLTPHTSPSAGQGTIEYLLLTALVIGVMMTVFQQPLRDFVDKYKSRKAEYTTVMQQKQLGIPRNWFGRRIPPPTGATPEGGDSSSAATQPINPNTANNPPDTAPGSPEGGPGGGGPGSGVGPARNFGGSTAGGSTSNLQTSLNNPKGSGSGSKTGGADELGNQGSGTTGGTTGGGGGGGSRGEFVGGSVSKDKNEATAKEAEQEKTAKTKKTESELALEQARLQYGSKADRVIHGGCENLELKNLIQIVAVVALLMLILSLLFQKKGGGD